MITITKGGAVVFSGPAATNLYRAIALKQALIMYDKFKVLAAKNITATSMLAMATEYTGQPFKRGQQGMAALAMAEWIEEAKRQQEVVRDDF